jgi:hypothetical protein
LLAPWDERGQGLLLKAFLMCCPIRSIDAAASGDSGAAKGNAWMAPSTISIVAATPHARA